MPKKITELEPKGLWQHFDQLNHIPRPSHHETVVQEYVLAFAEKQGLEAQRDSVGNVIISKPATKGMENREGVILQGHLDMVPQANSQVTHDFTRDPIRTRLDGDWVCATDTTLGADNGIGVAAALAVLESKEIKHGPLEALFTANEEDGMAGAFGLKSELLHGGVLLNLDSEEEGEVSISCAGGANVNTRISAQWEITPEDSRGFRLTVSGLKGGHSGVDIHRGRGNAIKLLFRLLREGVERFTLSIAGISGGNMRNAIPREAQALITLPKGRVNELVAQVALWQRLLMDELEGVDAGAQMSLSQSELPEQVLKPSLQTALVNLINASPTGVMRMSDRMPGLVESSNNLAIVKTDPEGISIHNLVRSSVDSALEKICKDLIGLYSLAGGVSQVDGQYPGWKPNPESPVLQAVQRAYRFCFDEEVKVNGIHAGLECGILGATYPAWDMISFGPTIRYPHSPDERVHIPSVRRFWQLLLRTLMEIPEIR